jgi:hypothetical protein
MKLPSSFETRPSAAPQDEESFTRGNGVPPTVLVMLLIDMGMV